MIRRITMLSMMTLGSLLLAAPGASAASSATVHRDCFSDGVIDADYTLQELRGADGTAGADDREYYGWNECYASALRRLTAGPGETPVPKVPVRDTNRNGKIDPAEKKEAAEQQKAVDKKFCPDGGCKREEQEDETGSAPTDGGPGAGDDPTSGDSGDDDGTNASASSTEDDSTSWWPLLLLVPALILGFGVWRDQRRRSRRRADLRSHTAIATGTMPEKRSRKRKRAAAADGDDGLPPSSYASGPDQR